MVTGIKSKSDNGGFTVQCQGEVMVTITGDQAKLIRQSGCEYFNNAFRHGTVESESRILFQQNWSVATLCHLVELLCSGKTFVYNNTGQEICLSEALDYVQADYRICLEKNTLHGIPTSRRAMEILRASKEPVFSYLTEMDLNKFTSLLDAGFFLHRASDQIVEYHTGLEESNLSVVQSVTGPATYSVYSDHPEASDHCILSLFCAALKGDRFHIDRTMESIPFMAVPSNNNIGFVLSLRPYLGASEAKNIANQFGAKEVFKSIGLIFEKSPLEINFILECILRMMNWTKFSAELYVEVSNGFMLRRFLHEFCVASSELCVHIDPKQEKVFVYANEVYMTSTNERRSIRHMLLRLGDYGGPLSIENVRLCSAKNDATIKHDKFLTATELSSCALQKS